jgi:nitrogen fixation NifU-like protein
MSVDELYGEIILDHYRKPRNKGPLMGVTSLVHHDNPLCGDEIDLGLEISEGRIKRITFQGHGCAISQASASMMTEAVQGITLSAALELSEAIRQMMHGKSPTHDIGDLIALEGVAQFPVRVKCALLAWTALQDAIQRAAGDRG